MTRSASEEALEAKADLLKALGHPARLLILNLVRMKPRHGEELAAILALSPATISHHLGMLTHVGLLTSRKDQYYQTYSLVSEALNRTLAEIIRISPTGPIAGVEEDAFRNKVLRTFLRRGRLISIPAQLKKKIIVLERIAQEFVPGRSYTEREVNLTLLEFHEDVAELRRGLVDQRLLARERGIYQRTQPAEPGA